MHKRITFRHMDKSEAMEQHSNDQLVKIEHFLEGEQRPIYIDLTLEPSKVHEHHRIELRVKSPHYDLVSHYEKEGVDFYEALDHVIDVMYHQLQEHKRRLDDDKKQVGRHEEFKKQR